MATAHGMAAVAQVVADGAADPGRGRRAEGVAAAGIEALYRLNQTEASFLGEVVEVVAAALGFLASHAPHQRQVGVDHCIAVGDAAAALVGGDEIGIALAVVGPSVEGGHRLSRVA